MGSILGPHIINGVGPYLRALALWQPRVALFLDPNVDDVRAFKVACPATKVVARIYAPDSEIEGRIRANPEDAAQWAHDLARRNSAVAAGVVKWVQVANEVCQFWDSLPLLNRFELRRMQLAETAGFGCAIGGFSVGQPDLPIDDRLALWRQVYPMLERADRSQRRHVLLIHQYGAPDLYGPAEKGGAPWLINRYETQVMPRLPYKALGVVCGEYGIDGLLLNDLGRAVADEAEYGVGVSTPPKHLYTADAVRAAGAPPRGWSAFTSASEYVRALVGMAGWLEQFSSQMLGYCLFTLGHNAPWGSYDIAGPVLDGLAAHYSTAAPVTPPTPITPPTLAQRLATTFGAQFHDLRASLPHHATLTYAKRPLSAVQQVILHHTVTAQTTTWQTVANYHVNSRGWPGIGYHLGVHADGRVSLLNDLETISYHAGNANGVSVSISVMGNYETDTVNAMLWQRIVDVQAVINTHLGRPLPMLGHRDAVGSATVCPGKNLYAKLTTPTPEVPMSNDPRAANCRKFAVDAQNQIIGIELVVQRSPSAMYELYRAEMLDPYHSGGNTVVKVVVLDSNNVEVSEKAVKGWPWPALNGNGSPALSGNSNNEWEITSKFDASKTIGPLAFYVMDAQNNVISDMVAGYGQAMGYGHISGRVTFKERSGAVVPPVDPGGALPEQEPVMAVGLLADKIRWWMEESVRQDEAGNAARAKAIRYSLIRLNGGLLYRLERALKGGQAQG